MIRINLAPEVVSELPYRELARDSIILAVVAALGYGIPMLYGSSLQDEAEGIKSQTRNKETQLRKLQFDLDEAKSLREKVETLKARKSRIQDLGRGRKQPILVFDKLQQLHLDKVWLESLSFQEQKISMQGYALDLMVISEYMNRLKSVNGEKNSVDTRTFEPKFLKPSPTPDASAAKGLMNANFDGEPQGDQLIFPVTFSNIVLKKTETKDETKSQPEKLKSFELEFSTNAGNVTVN